MNASKVSSPVDIGVSGLKAQALRMNVFARNIANVDTTRAEGGEPYRKRNVILAIDPGGGVQIKGIAADMLTPFKEHYAPGHPDADENSFVQMPNVELPVEMMHMMTASRAYQANAATIKRYQEMVDVTLELLR